MANYSVQSADEYIAAAPDVAKSHLRELKRAVEAAMPEVEKDLGYGKPYFKYKGWVAGFDVYKNHIGFEVWDGLTADDRKELEDLGYKTGSVTFQIRYEQDIPADIITRLIKTQVEKNEAKKSLK